VVQGMLSAIRRFGSDQSADCIKWPTDPFITASGRDDDFDGVHAAWLCACCQLSYFESDIISGIVRERLGWNEFFFLEDRATDTQAFIMGRDDALILACRGTMSMGDWQQNFKVSRVVGPEPDVLASAGTADAPPAAELSSLMVHEGFRQAAVSLHDPLTNFLRLDSIRKTPRKLYITGHSLGGAIASIVFLYLSLGRNRSLANVAGVYTFGQPRVISRFSPPLPVSSVFYRIVNYSDVVPSLPGPGKFRHFGQLTYIDKKGILHPPGTYDKEKCTAERHKALLRKGPVSGGIFTHFATEYFDAIMEHSPTGD